ncbi:MAG: sigma factor, partial [Nitrospinota bacterium]|nr:sigma factor [Nitrospinota bacterium]
MVKKNTSPKKTKRPKTAKKKKKPASKPPEQVTDPKNSGDFEDAVLPKINPIKASDPSLGEDTLSIYLHELGKYDVLSREDEHEYAVKVKNGSEEAFNHLVRSNLRYVVSVANRYKGLGLSLEDLINEGNIGLIHAIRRFDPDRGVKLIT